MNQVATVFESSQENQLERDIFDVKQAMTDYVWALDTSDWKRLRAVFADDVVFRASNMGHYEGGDNLVKEFQNRTVRTPVRRHLLITPYVTVSGDTAEFTSYLVNVRVRPGAPGGDYYFGSGYYRNLFRRTPDGWKMYDFKWEAILLEGNTQMIPSMGPMLYLPVMKGPADAPWGGAAAPNDRGFLSSSHQVENLVIGLVRAADAKVATDLLASLAPNASAKVGSTQLTGSEAIANSLCPADRSGWQATFLTNTVVSVHGRTARFGSYVYVTASGTEGRADHSGGVLTVSAEQSDGGWKVTEYNYTPLWNRDEPITSDRIASVGAGNLPSMLWPPNSRRERMRNEEEVVALMSKYTWCYDLGDFDLMREVFHEDTDSSFHMGEPVFNIGRDQMLKMMKENRSKVHFSQHYIFNPDVEIGLDGNSAFLRCYSETRRTHDDGGEVTMAGGHYYIHARRYEGQWKFDSFRYYRAHAPYL